MRIIDLSVTIADNMAVYPGDPEVRVEVVQTVEQHSWEVRRLTMGSHTGTHVDAFSHMHAGGKSIDEIPLQQFFGKAIVADVQQEFPAATGLFFTEEAGMELLKRIVAASPPFVGGALTVELERALLQASIVTYTDLVNLEQLPVQVPFTFYGFPLKIWKGDGSPVRAVAVLE